MSYELERKTLSNLIMAQDCFGLDKESFGFDQGPVVIKDGSGFMTIFSGVGRLASMGGDKLKVEYPNLLTITFFMADGQDSRASKIIADGIVDHFFDRIIDETEIVLKFGVPYISSVLKESPQIRTSVNIPFVRIQLNSRSI